MDRGGLSGGGGNPRGARGTGARHPSAAGSLGGGPGRLDGATSTGVMRAWASRLM